jgi:hypothetical protein
MIQPLRKTHRRVFLFLAIALPVFLFAGIRARHRLPPQPAVHPKRTL